MFDILGVLGRCEGCSWFHCGLGGQGSRGSESWQGASPPDCTAAGRSALCLEGVGGSRGETQGTDTKSQGSWHGGGLRGWVGMREAEGLPVAQVREVTGDEQLRDSGCMAGWGV